MAWRSISISDVRLSPAEKAALQNIQGSEDVGAAVLLTVVREFVSAIRSGGNAFVDDDTLPDLVRVHAINRTRWMWLCEFPQLKAFQTADRKALNDRAEEVLTDIASGKPPVEPPPNPTTSAAPGNAVELATKPNPSRFANRKKMDGLV